LPPSKPLFEQLFYTALFQEKMNQAQANLLSATTTPVENLKSNVEGKPTQQELVSVLVSKHTGSNMRRRQHAIPAKAL